MIHFLSSNSKKGPAKEHVVPYVDYSRSLPSEQMATACADTDSRLHSRPELQSWSLYSLGYSYECELIWNPDVSEKKCGLKNGLCFFFYVGHCSVDDVT